MGIQDLEGARIFVAGHRGMVGSAIVRRLAGEKCEVLTAAREELDLLDRGRTRAWLENNRPDIVVVAAARVGGIKANDEHPVDFLEDNLAIALNVISGSHRAGVRKLLFLGSTCVYPKEAPQPIPEDALLTGPLEPTNQWYAVAKIAGIKLCQAYRRQYGCDYISAMPSNLYGPGDNYHPTGSHVLPGLIGRFHKAVQNGDKAVTVWGTGRPKREFLYVDDLADACVFLLAHYSAEGIVNVGTGKDISIGDVAKLVAEIVGFRGEIAFDASYPDGTMLKRSDTRLIESLGWHARTSLKEGLAKTYAAFLAGQGRGI
jgi:GDP-L-fucose synthase